MKRKFWVSGDEIIRRNSEEETARELYGNGYLSRLSKRIEEIDKAIKADDEARKQRAEMRLRARQRALERKKKADQTEEMGL